jgi:hypothetical protein
MRWQHWKTPIADIASRKPQLYITHEYRPSPESPRSDKYQATGFPTGEKLLPSRER